MISKAQVARKQKFSSVSNNCSQSTHEITYLEYEHKIKRLRLFICLQQYLAHIPLVDLVPDLNESDFIYCVLMIHSLNSILNRSRK